MGWPELGVEFQLKSFIVVVSVGLIAALVGMRAPCSLIPLSVSQQERLQVHRHPNMHWWSFSEPTEGRHMFLIKSVIWILNKLKLFTFLKYVWYLCEKYVRELREILNVPLTWWSGPLSGVPREDTPWKSLLVESCQAKLARELIAWSKVERWFNVGTQMSSNISGSHETLTSWHRRTSTAHHHLPCFN